MGFTSRATIVAAGSNEESVEELDVQRALDNTSEKDKDLPNPFNAQTVQDPNNPPEPPHEPARRKAN